MSSSFLEKLISGGVAVDNNAPPDAHGVITRRIVKAYAAQPPEEIGLTLSDDAEVLDVINGSLAHQANIPQHFMIFEVNNTFIEDSRSFFDYCRCNLTLTIKLQSVSAISELIAEILLCEEKYSGDELRKHLRLDERVRTTPRFSFLAGDHPLFRRYTRRLDEKRDANALIKQRVEEMKMQEQREIMEAMKKTLEDERRIESEKRPKQIVTVSTEVAEEPAAPFVEVYEHRETIFTKKGSDTKMELEKESSDTIENAPIPSNSTNLEPENVSCQELLKLVCVPESYENEREPVRYVILPSEEYVLSSGEKAVHALKKRIGPPPSPPL